MTRLEHLRELLKMAADRGQNEKSTDFLFKTAEALGMTETNNPGERWMVGYSATEGEEALWLLYRYYDQSQAFSPRPDRNLIEIRLYRSQVATSVDKFEYED